MFEAILHRAGDLAGDLLTFLVQDVAFAQAEAAASIRESGIDDLATVLLFTAGPAVAVIGLVHSKRSRFTARHGASAARGWVWTITAFALCWAGVVHAAMTAEAERGAWTSATLTPFLLWLIGLGAMAAVTYVPLGAHGIVRRIASGN